MIFGGRGGRNFWIFRIGMLVLLLTAGAVFQHRGAGYWTMRSLYYVVIIGLVAAAALRNRSRRRVGPREPGSFSGPSPYQGGAAEPPFGSQYPPSSPYRDLPVHTSPDENPPAVPSVAPIVAEPQVRVSPPAEVKPLDARLSAPAEQPGWHPDPLDPMARHYWDGRTWSRRVKWDGANWVSA